MSLIQQIKSRRKIIFINPKFQLKIMLYFFFTGLLIAMIFIAGQIYFIRNLYSLGESVGLKATHPYFVFISTQSDRMLIITTITSVITMLIISFASLFLSHKIAGPMYNLTNWFRRMRSSDEKMPALKFRDGDFFDEIPEVINETLKEKNLIK